MAPTPSRSTAPANSTPDGQARFLARPHQVPRELTDHEFPFILTTGRVYAYWHTLTRTAKCEKLNRRDPAAYLEIHPDDARKLNVVTGEPVQISSRRGTIRLPVRVSEQVAPGQVFLPFHWGDLYGQGNAINYLTIAATDNISKQPELKFCSVAIEKIPAELTATTRTPTPAEVAQVFAPVVAAPAVSMEPVNS